MKSLLLILTLILAATLPAQPEWESWDKKDKDKKHHPHHPVVPEPATTGVLLVGAAGGISTTDVNSGVFTDYNFLREHNKYLLINYTDIGSDIKIGENKSYYWQKEGVQFKEEVNFWLKHRDWYEKRGLMWRRGCLLSSSPGQGKSKMVLETARELDLPLYRFDISTMSNSEFQDNFNSVEYGSIIALEDIDTVFNLRENIQQKNLQKQLLTFDCLINTINGVKENSGVFLVITTNKLDMLGPALTRAGRLDAKIEVGPLDEGGRRFIAQNILVDWPEEIDRVVEEKTNISVVEFTHLCMEKAIELFNKQRAK
jgi:SpoVK/Ycf46/Vps4 family AAA+-type ATPase